MNISDKEEMNFKLFEQMTKDISKDIRDKDWECWKFQPEANFFMTENKR